MHRKKEEDDRKASQISREVTEKYHKDLSIVSIFDHLKNLYLHLSILLVFQRRKENELLL